MRIIRQEGCQCSQNCEPAGVCRSACFDISTAVDQEWGLGLFVFALCEFRSLMLKAHPMQL